MNRKIFCESDGINNSISTKYADSAVFHFDGRIMAGCTLGMSLQVKCNFFWGNNVNNSSEVLEVLIFHRSVVKDTRFCTAMKTIKAMGHDVEERVRKKAGEVTRVIIVNFRDAIADLSISYPIYSII